MLLNELIKNAPQIEIQQLSLDSRVPMKDCVFFCIKGVKYNGHEYIDEAIKNGAKVIVYSDDVNTKRNAIFVKVSDVNDALARISNKFYDYPANKMDIILTAGVYGKSTVNKLIYNLLNNFKETGYIGVRGIRYKDKKLMSQVTTQTVLENQKTLCEFVKNDIKVATLEGSALTFEYRKLNFLNPDIFIYTTSSDERAELGRENINVVQRYMYTLDNTTTVILNRDDKSYDSLYPSSPSNIITYGTSSKSDLWIKEVKLSTKNTEFTLDINGMQYNVLSKLLGMANVYNLTAAIAALLVEGIKIEDILEYVREVNPPSGVVERVDIRDYNVIVDCCSTIESYKAVFDFAKRVTRSFNKVVAMISINSTDNKQRLKNLMSLAASYNFHLILTEDDSYQIDINENLNNARDIIPNTNCLLVEDREEAIECGIELLNKNDMLLLLGKGNEKILYKGLAKIKYEGDKNLALKYMNKRLKEELIDDYQ